MFRAPRSNRNHAPSLGRPPTPPPPPLAPARPAARGEGAGATLGAREAAATLDARGAGGSTMSTKTAKRPNGSILTFFKKEARGMFVEERAEKRRRVEVEGPLEEEMVGEEEEKEEEGDGVVGLEGGGGCSPPPVAVPVEVEGGDGEGKGERRVGPFVEESDDEGEGGLLGSWREESGVEEAPHAEEKREERSEYHPPMLKHERTSYGEQDGFAEFEELGEFEDEEYPEEGEEYMERRYMQEQRRLEMAEGGFEGDYEVGEFEFRMQDEEESGAREMQADAPACPICSASLEGVSDQDASVHVNNCLDGNPTPLPTAKPEAAMEANSYAKGGDAANGASKFKKPPRPARPGQDNPFNLGSSEGTTSAFSKLMSGHAEDMAWASAAKSENESRGKPSWQRTCPFYKILPGFSICVDAFRYGAVQGCNAYFLSHFHSDHYIGLTANWSHGPIYCSRPTANLVRQQLRVDPRYVVDVEFEKKFEVPGTDGVHVTMIPANHCPGSSIFLFEKTIGKGKTPRVQRVLHCGDFRACPAHVEHPLLRPTVQDAINGSTAQQKIDVCYLDTTYLNPKFAFPSQEDVIQACSDKCVALNNPQQEPADTTDLEKLRPGGNLSSFVQREPSSNTNTTTIDTGTSTAGRLLVVVGTYSIGKERMCVGLARALNSLIYAPPGKQRICACLEDPELSRLLTSDPRAAQVHMTPLFEIRAETVAEYLAAYSDRFSRAVAFRPSGWNYRPPGSRFTESPAVETVLHSESWKSGYGARDLVPQRGSNSKAQCFGVPYSEHSSFRELTMFCCALRIDKVIPTVNVGSARSRERMKLWCERWAAERKKNGLFVPREVVPEDEGGRERRSRWYAGKGTMELRTTL